MGATLGEPSRDLVGRQARGQRPQVRPGGKEGVLNGPIIGPEPPIRAALHERVSETLEPFGGPYRRARPERRPEALVGALVEIEARQEFVVEALWRRGDGAAVVGQRRIERQPSP